MILPVWVTLLGSKVFRINAVVLGSNSWLSIFNGIALIVESFFQTFNLIKGTRTNNMSLNRITVSNVKGSGASRHNGMVLGSNPEFRIPSD